MLVDPRDFVIINDQVDLPDGYTLTYGKLFYQTFLGTSIDYPEIPEVKGT